MKSFSFLFIAQELTRYEVDTAAVLILDLPMRIALPKIREATPSFGRDCRNKKDESTESAML